MLTIVTPDELRMRALMQNVYQSCTKLMYPVILVQKPHVPSHPSEKPNQTKLTYPVILVKNQIRLNSELMYPVILVITKSEGSVWHCFAILTGRSA